MCFLALVCLCGPNLFFFGWRLRSMCFSPKGILVGVGNAYALFFCLALFVFIVPFVCVCTSVSSFHNNSRLLNSQAEHPTADGYLTRVNWFATKLSTKFRMTVPCVPCFPKLPTQNWRICQKTRLLRLPQRPHCYSVYKAKPSTVLHSPACPTLSVQNVIDLDR